MEKTLVLLKPSAIVRNLAGTVLARFEQKGLQLVGIKMLQLTDEILDEHYAHLVGLPFYPKLKESMKATPVIACCFEGVECIQVVRNLTGATNGRNAQPGTIRGDYSVSGMENIVHASDSVENAAIELNRFFSPEEIFTYERPNLHFIYTASEIQ